MKISMKRVPHRLERLRSWMEDESLDCTVVFGADNVNHLCGYWRYFGGVSALVVGGDGERTLVVMLDEARIARELSDADEVIGFGERGFGIDLDPVAGLIESLSGVPVVRAARRLGVASEIPGAAERLGQAVSGELVDAAQTLYRIRLIKDDDEFEKILAGYQLCWLGQKAVEDGARPGAAEIELYTAAQSAAQLAAGQPVEFVCDLLSGPNAAEVCCPIHVAGRRVVEANDPVVADVVVRVNGYWGDSAGTYVAGENDEVEEARTGLFEALETARKNLVPGNTGSEIFREMKGWIESTFRGGELPHHGGHALGLTSFEDPHLIPSDKIPFEPGMVLAVEPGVYVPGRFGARVENLFIVTPDGGVELREAMGAR